MKLVNETGQDVSYWINCDAEPAEWSAGFDLYVELPLRPGLHVVHRPVRGTIVTEDDLKLWVSAPKDSLQTLQRIRPVVPIDNEHVHLACHG